MEISAKGKIILVTGGSKGIGAAAVEALVESGANVACQYNHSEDAVNKFCAKYPEQVIALQADLENSDDIATLIPSVLDKWGKIDVLINNAGIVLHSDVTLPDDKWIAHWQRTLQVNLIAAALLCKHAIPVFQEQHSGIIINVSSRAAHRGDTPDYLAYAASKGGLESLTKSLARGYGKDGITVFGIAPGFTRTDMAADFIRTYGEQYALQDIALNELTEPADLAPTFVFLSSGMASHATGTTIDINAGSYVR